MSEEAKPRNIVKELQDLLNESGTRPYINPFYDSKNAREFGRYIHKIWDLQAENKILRERLGLDPTSPIEDLSQLDHPQHTSVQSPQHTREVCNEPHKPDDLKEG